MAKSKKIKKSKKPAKQNLFARSKKLQATLFAVLFALLGFAYLRSSSAATLPTSCPGVGSLKQQVFFQHLPPPGPPNNSDFVLSTNNGSEIRHYYYKYSNNPVFVNHQIDSITPANSNYTHSDWEDQQGIVLDYAWYFSNPNTVVQPRINYHYMYDYPGQLWVQRYNTNGGLIGNQPSSGGPSVTVPLATTYRQIAYGSVTGPKIGPCNTSPTSSPTPNTSAPTAEVPETVVAQTPDGRTVAGAVFHVYIRHNVTNALVDYNTRTTPWPLNTNNKAYSLRFVSAPAGYIYRGWQFPDGRTGVGAESGEFSSTAYDNKTIVIKLEKTAATPTSPAPVTGSPGSSSTSPVATGPGSSSGSATLAPFPSPAQREAQRAQGGAGAPVPRPKPMLVDNCRGCSVSGGGAAASAPRAARQPATPRGNKQNDTQSKVATIAQLPVYNQRIARTEPCIGGSAVLSATGGVCNGSYWVTYGIW